MVSCGEVRPQIHPQMVQCGAMRHQSPSAMARYDAKCILQWSIAVQFGAVRHTHANAFSLILTEFNRCPFSVFFTMFFSLLSGIREWRQPNSYGTYNREACLQWPALKSPLCLMANAALGSTRNPAYLL